MIRIGIVGINYGRTVQLPAFRADPRCQVIALAGRDTARTGAIAGETNVTKGYGDWRALVEDPDVQAVAIATLPSLQAQIAIRALELGKPVFIEKPMANTLAAAYAMLRQAMQSRLPTMIDFNFTEIMAWLRAKAMLDAGAVGALRHVTVHWHVESRALQRRMRNWKTVGDDGGGVLGNFISHCFHYLEWFCGPIGGLSARIGGLPSENDLETTVAMAMQFKSGPLVSLSMSCASYLGAGHRIEFFGEDGTLVLHNPGTDYMRGFELFHAKRPAAPLECIAVVDPIDAQYPDGRIAPVSRLAKRFFDAIENGGTAMPGFAEGYRAQRLMDAARRSHEKGQWIDFAAEDSKEEDSSVSVRKILVTGGSGFIGSGLVTALVHAGCALRVLDDNSRGSPRRLADVAKDIEFVGGDVRDAETVARAAQGMDEVHHLAFVNGTEFFYKMPELVLDVGVRGMINVIDACRKHNVGTLVLASSSEVYQTPPHIPTDETAPLTVPDVQNPRYSYGAGKLISEVMAINFGRKYFERVLIFRPHNVYGPDMGWEHVIPQLALRLQALGKRQPSGKLRFDIQGTGAETRSFCYIDDLVAGVMIMREKGEHLGIYHVGTAEEVSIAELALRIAGHAAREIELVLGRLQAGGTMRRCPDISKLSGLGYKPRVPLAQGLPPTLDWYWQHADLAPKS